MLTINLSDLPRQAFIAHACRYAAQPVRVLLCGQLLLTEGLSADDAALVLALSLIHILRDSRTNIDLALGSSAAAIFDHQLSSPFSCFITAGDINALFKTHRSLRGNAETARGAADRYRIKGGSFNQNIRGLFSNLRIHTAHNTCYADRAIVIADEDLATAKLAVFADVYKRQELLISWAIPAI